MDNIEMDNERKRRMEALRIAATPLMDFLSENYHPHFTATVDSYRVILSENQMQVFRVERKEQEAK